MANKAAEMLGKKFGTRKVLKRGKNRGVHLYWLCLCDCGRKDYVMGRDLRLGIGCPSCSASEKNMARNSLEALKTGHETSKKAADLRWAQILPQQFYKKLIDASEYTEREFSVSKEYLENLLLKQGFRCSISGVQIKIAKPYYKKANGTITKIIFTTASLDRIDSSKGYIVGNVQWVHKRVNQMKWDEPQQDLIDWCHKISTYQKAKANA